MENILVVDDMKTERELIGSVVTKAGHNPVYADDGAHALQKARIGKPALIFLDVVMPVQDGFKTCRSLKKEADTAKIPVVLVTSKGTESDKFWGKKQGADDHVVKPFTPEKLIELIRRHVR